MYLHDSKIIDYIIRQAPLRRRLSFSYLLTFVGFIFIGLITYVTSTNTLKEFEHFARYSKQSQLDLQLVKNISELELSAFRFIHDGHESAAKNVLLIYQTMLKKLKQSRIEIKKDIIKERLKKIKFLLINYMIVFEKAKVQRKLQADLIDTQFRETGTKIEKLLDKYTAVLNDERSPGDSKLNISKITNALLSVEKNAFRYFDILDLKYVSFAKQNFKNAIRKLNAQLQLETHRENHQIIHKLLQKISAYERIFLEAVQRTRGYLYLINVVMSADTYEMLYQSKKIAETLELNIEQTEKNILDDIFKSLLILTITIILFLITMTVFSYLIGLTVTKPINQLTKIFNKLSLGSKDKINITSTHHDEISELIYAAKIFRDKNIQSQILLDQYKNLNDTLEAKVENRTRELKEKNDELLVLAITDSLTGIYNRVKLDNVLNNEIKRCKRYAEFFSVMIIDIDDFKSVNDTYGHQVGDTVLSEFSQILKNTVRETDVLGRWGGEEFLILSPQTNKEGITKLAEKIRLVVETYNFSTIKKKTASFGTATYIKKDKRQTIIERADKALYLAKDSGKNQVKFC